jgi:subtilisin
MGKLTLLAAAAAVLTLAGCSGDTLNVGTGQPHTASALPSQAAGRYIVVMADSSTPAQVGSVIAGCGAAPLYTYDVALKGFAAVLSPAQLAKVKADPQVKYVEQDAVVTTCAQSTGWGVDRIDADLNANEGAGIAVAIIDTGISLSHPDLAGNVGSGKNFVNTRKTPEDDNGHGSHVAGVVAAVNNSIGYIGVGSQITVIPVKVLDSRGSGLVSTINAGINWVAANAASKNIKVANMSLGGGGYIASMHAAIVGATAQGVTFVVAAGNSFANAANYSPSGFDDTVITVSALTSSNTFANYSNWGGVVDLIAPGSSIPSLWRSGGYATISGTSMASPHVAGAAALYIKNHPAAGFIEVRDALVAAGEAGTWAGDPDGVSEKLVDAQSL